MGDSNRWQAPWSWVALFALVAAGPLWLPVVAEGPSAEETAAMEAWMKSATPGPHHEHLARMAGTWDVRGKMWMSPGAPPVESRGTMAARMVLGGRYLESRWDTEFLGEPFEGLSMEGWDNLLERYVGQWWDNMSTQTLVSDGSCSDDGKVRTMATTGTDPMTGEAFRSRGVTTLTDDDHWTFESYRVLPDGSEHKEMEWHGERRDR